MALSKSPPAILIAWSTVVDSPPCGRLAGLPGLFMIGFGALELASIGEALGKSRVFAGERFDDPTARGCGFAGEGKSLV